MYQGIHLRIWAFPKLLRDAPPERHVPFANILDRHARILPSDCHRSYLRTFVRPRPLQDHAFRRRRRVMFRDFHVELVKGVLSDSFEPGHMYGARMRRSLRSRSRTRQPLIQHEKICGIGNGELWRPFR